MNTNNGPTQPQKVYRQVPNFNLVPPRGRGPAVPVKRLSFRILIAVVILAETLFISNLYRQRSGLEAAIELAQSRMQQIDNKAAQLARAQGTNAPTLEAALAALKPRLGGPDDDWEALGIEQPDWSAVIAAFYSTPKGMRLTSLNLTKNTGVIIVTGTASDYKTFLDYYNGLLASPLISEIRLSKSTSASAAISFSLEVVVRTTGE